MTEKVKEYIASLRGKKIAFVGMGVANAPSALFLLCSPTNVYACSCCPDFAFFRKIIVYDVIIVSAITFFL